MRFSGNSVAFNAPLTAFLSSAFPNADLSEVGPCLAAVVDGKVEQPATVFLRRPGHEVHLRITSVDCGCCGDQDERQPVLAVILYEPDARDLLPRAEMVLDSSADGVFIVNRDNRIVYFNQACERLTGWKREEVIMETWECRNIMQCHNEDGESMGSESLCPAKLFVRMETVPLEAHEMLITSAGGKERWVETSYSPICDAAGAVAFIVGIIRDIDERKRLESQLVQSRNLASLGQLVSGIAHEIKNPLGIIMSSVEVLLNSRRPASQRREAAEFIKDEVRRLDGRVKDFLAFARPKPMVSSRVNLNALLKKVLLSCTAHDRAALRIEQRLSCHAPIVAGDPDQLHQVILNLVLNADQAMPEGGTLTVTTEVAEDQVHMRFEDEGDGIADDDLQRIFDPFFTTKKDGTGLGLPIVHQILTGHRGKITVRNRDGGSRGVAVDIIMPLARGTAR